MQRSVTHSIIGLALALSLLLMAGMTTHVNLVAGAAPAAGIARDFVVTSARDAGPGSLREAILAVDRLSSRGHIVINVKRIALDSALPPLINPHGTDIESAPQAGLIDAGNQRDGAVIQVNSPASTLTQLEIVNARTPGIVINAPEVNLNRVAVHSSNVGVLVNPAARNISIRDSVFEGNDTAVLATPAVRDLTIRASTFRDNSHAAVWLVGHPEPEDDGGPSAQSDPSHRQRVQIIDCSFENNSEGVVANQSVSIQKSRFSDTADSAVLILGGSARIGYNEIRGSRGTAVSIMSGSDIVIDHNTLSANRTSAITLRDSTVTVEHNTLSRNSFGLVVIMTQAGLSPVIQDNVIAESTVDAVTLIGGTSRLQHNDIVANRGAGIRLLDLVRGQQRIAATAHVESNLMKDNGADGPIPGIYRLPSAP